jgi:hypothetical protein
VCAAAVVVLGAAACGGQTEAKPEAKASPTAPSVTEAREAFQGDLRRLQIAGCPPDCTTDLQQISHYAGELRKAMNADPKVGAEFYSPAYALIDKIQTGARAVDGTVESQRPQVLGPAHDLSDWLDEHPTQ